MMRRISFAAVLGAIALVGAAATASAQTNVSPTLSAGLGSFYTDRYTPPVFTLSGIPIQGRNNVLQIGVNSSSDLASRAGGYQSTFYNTQGKKTDVNTAGSWFFESDLFVNQSWMDNANGYVRTDIWATATDDAFFSDPSAYPIIGFTNYGGAARFRGYDVNTDAWIDFGNAVNAGSWNTLMMAFDAGTNTFSYSVNGSVAGSVVGAIPTTGVGNVMYQAYNFNDPKYASGNPAFTADWSNTPTDVVPEPASMTLLATGLVGMAGAAMRRRKRSTKA